MEYRYLPSTARLKGLRAFSRGWTAEFPSYLCLKSPVSVATKTTRKRLFNGAILFFRIASGNLALGAPAVLEAMGAVELLLGGVVFD